MNLNYVHVGDWCSAEPVWRWTTTGGSNPTAAEVLPETVDWRGSGSAPGKPGDVADCWPSKSPRR